jgi:hypothetical protein
MRPGASDTERPRRKPCLIVMRTALSELFYRHLSGERCVTMIMS